jgi:hypothetical protein
MPFTAPSSVTRLELSIFWIDDSGDTTSVNIPIRTGLTSANINSAVADIAAAGNANLYRYEVREVHTASKDAGVALDAEQNSVYDTAVVLYKREDTKQSLSLILPAFRETLMRGDTDNVDTSNAVYIAARNAYDGLLPAEFVAQTVRYTERRESNTVSSPA